MLDCKGCSLLVHNYDNYGSFFYFLINNFTMAQFDWFPYLQGKLLHYYQWFALIASTLFMLVALFSFFSYLLLSKINEKSIQTSSYNQSIISKLKNITFNSTFISLSLIPLVCAALDVIGFIAGLLGMSSLLVVMLVLNNGRQHWHLRSEYSAISSGKVFTKLALKMNPQLKKKILTIIVISLIANLLMYKTCVCFFNRQIGYYNDFLGFGMNTYFTRFFQMNKSCPEGAPCHMYATIPQDPAHDFFLNVHTHPNVKNVTIFYREVDGPATEFSKIQATSYDYHGLEWKASRKVHSALIIGLKPDTKYLTIVHYNNQNWTNAIYKTLTNDPSKPINMINAGDSGYTDASYELAKIVATLNPDVFFIGGDIAYDDNMPACAYTWDYFLTQYGRITATLGYLMPIVLTVGNHDVGLNELPGVNVTINNYGPAYFIYFPQHYDQTADGKILKQVPPLQRRRTFFEYTFGNVLYVCLDSGYLHSFDGIQKAFMIDSFERNIEKVKFVNYHVPIYNPCGQFDRDPSTFIYQLFHWVPNFDKYKVMTAFENHVHYLKRTKPMIGNSIDQKKGTVYVGSAFGAVLTKGCHPDQTAHIFDALANVNNFWISKIYPDRVEHIAYDPSGNITDQFTQYTSDYLLKSQQESKQS